MNAYIVKRRWWHGVYTYRSCMGTKRGNRWGKWVTMGKYDSCREAEDQVDKLNRGQMVQIAVFYRGKIMYKVGVE